MIDLKVLRDDPDLVRASQRVRGADESLVDVLLAADAARRAAVTRGDELRGEQKTIGKSVSKASPDERPVLLERAKALSAEVKAAEVEQDLAETALREAQLAVPNLVEDGVPPGGEDDFVTLEEVGTIPRVADPREHTEIGAALKAIDTERGAKVSGSRFYFLTGVGAQLELALVNLAMAQATEAGFVPVIAPALVRPEIMEGTGFLGAHAAEVYKLADDELYLVGTSEVALAGYHSGEILNEIPLALRGILVLLSSRGRLVRQGHPRHHPGALVRQGRDVLLRPPGRGEGRAPAAAGVGARVPGQARTRLPRHRRRRR